MRIRMNPPWNRNDGRRRAAGILVAAILGLPFACANSTTNDPTWLRLSGWNGPVAFRQVEKSPDNVPVPEQPPRCDVSRRNLVRSLERVPVGPLVHGSTRDLLHQAGAGPAPGSRLDFCPEFTKPDSLCIRLMGTPKNHRSPPA